VIAFHRLGEHLQELQPVLVVQEDVLAGVAAAGDVTDSAPYWMRNGLTMRRI